MNPYCAMPAIVVLWRNLTAQRWAFLRLCCPFMVCSEARQGSILFWQPVKPLFKRAASFVLCAILCSCASSRVSNLYEFYEIESKGESKFFGYRFVLDPAQRQPGTSGRSIPDHFAISFDDMRKELKKYMAVYPYCTEGYFVYDESFDGQRYRLLGECQESRREFNQPFSDE